MPEVRIAAYPRATPSPPNSIDRACAAAYGASMRVVVLSLFLCASSAAPTMSAPVSVNQAPSTRGLAARIDTLMEPWNGEEAPGCSVAVTRAGNVLHAEGYGLANLEHRIPNRADTVFDIGSTSKQFTAAAIQLLARAGTLQLNDDVRRFLPELPASYDTLGEAQITVADLLHHTSGLRDYGRLISLAGWGLGLGWGPCTHTTCSPS